MSMPTVEELLLAWSAAAMPDIKFRTELPGGTGGLSSVVPIARLVRVGGADDILTMDRATVDVDAFGLTRGEAFAIAERIRHEWRTNLPGALFNGGSFKAVRTSSAPAWRPWDDTNVRRIGALYEITLHTF